MEPEEPICPDAHAFASRLETVIFERTSASAPIGLVLQMQLILQHEFHRWRGKADERHQRLEGAHRCIFQVYCDAYDRLRDIESRIVPPMDLIADYYHPPPPVVPLPPPSPSPQQQIAGIFFGEQE